MAQLVVPPVFSRRQCIKWDDLLRPTGGATKNYHNWWHHQPEHCLICSLDENTSCTTLHHQRCTCIKTCRHTWYLLPDWVYWQLIFASRLSIDKNLLIIWYISWKEIPLRWTQWKMKTMKPWRTENRMNRWSKDHIIKEKMWNGKKQT